MLDNRHSRRQFLQYSGLATTAMMVPNFLKASGQEAYSGKKLVIIQLSGGNDGLNTVVPIQNDIYYRSRPTIALQKSETLRIDDEAGLHPEMTALASLYEEGQVSILNNVGYPNPNRSHFRSMDIWHTASNADEIINTGWIGRYLDAACGSGECRSHLALEIDDTLSLALKGAQVKALALSDPDKLHKVVTGEFYKSVTKMDVSGQQNDELYYLYKTLAETASSAEYLYDRNKIYKSSSTYPTNRFGKSLKTIAELIISGVESRIYYASISGFDTHANQRNAQSRHLKSVSEGIGALVNDLKANNRMDETLIMVFSEFGRRVEQNASNGTDHGAANNLFLIGHKLKKPGLYNGPTDLSKLDEGDLRHDIDFRQVYAALMKQWLGSETKDVLNGGIQALPLI